MTNKVCRWCASGNKPNEKGDHWIVKSFVPAKITIKKCEAIPAATPLTSAERSP